MIDNESILITGGTGSFGQRLVKTLLNKFNPKKVVIYSRDELKQYEMKQSFVNEDRIRFFIGDVRDGERLKRATEGIDTIFHAAALKQVPIAEYNPFECIKTNILGAQNVIEASLSQGVKRIIALSTDKAAAPINLYGATKLCSDKLFIASNNIKGNRDYKASIVRYGNVMGSRGSVIPYFLKIKHNKEIPITHPDMTRFNLTLDEGIKFSINCLYNMWGGEIFVPKIPSYRIEDVAEAIAPKVEKKVIGVRPGEKFHEEMITTTDSMNTIEFKKYFTILPSVPLWPLKEYMNKDSNDIGRRCKKGQNYNSKDNPDFLTVSQLRKLIDNELLSTQQPTVGH